MSMLQFQQKFRGIADRSQRDYEKLQEQAPDGAHCTWLVLGWAHVMTRERGQDVWKDRKLEVHSEHADHLFSNDGSPGGMAAEKAYAELKTVHLGRREWVEAANKAMIETDADAPKLSVSKGAKADRQGLDRSPPSQARALLWS